MENQNILREELEKELDIILNEYDMINTYFKEIEERKNKKRDEVVALFEKLGIEEYSNELMNVKISSKTTFKYIDENRIISYLKENGLEKFVKEKIDTTPFNKELKKENSELIEILKDYYQKNISSSIVIMIQDDKNKLDKRLKEGE